MPSRGRDRHHVVISEHSRSEGVFVVKVLHDDEEPIASVEVVTDDPEMIKILFHQINNPASPSSEDE